jgi:hypothetical protein
MKTRTYRIILDTPKRILLKTMMSLASIATTLYQTLSQVVEEKLQLNMDSGKRNCLEFCFIIMIPWWLHTEDK